MEESTVTNEPAALVGPDTLMGDILRAYPGARRALFAKYHVGGCQSCSYADEETLAEVCERNEEMNPVDKVIEHIESAHESDLRMLIEPVALRKSLGSDSPPRLVDLRSREEFESGIVLAGAELYSEDLVQNIYAKEEKDRLIVFYDHQGESSLDRAAFLIGHGYGNAKALRGGIDAYSQEADSEIPRYRLEFE